MGFIAEARRLNNDGTVAEDWYQLGGPYASQERAKAECKHVLDAEPQNRNRYEFRTVGDDARKSIFQECKPPHAWRLRWSNARW